MTPEEAFLAISDERDLYEEQRLAAWRDGYHAATTDHAADYATGFTDGWAAYKAAQHNAVTDLRQHLATWDGLRENFGQPRPGDYQGGPVPPW